jgi:sporulation protein YlmC with PRC-barrel domain
VAAVPLFAQTQSTTSSTTTTNYIQTSKLIGTKVKASGGEEVGEIQDVVLDQNGCMAYTVVSTGAGGGGGSRVTTSSSNSVKTVAVPWSVYSTTSDPRVVTVRVERDRIYNAPAFEYSRINEYSSGGYINNVNSYYGVSASVGVNGSANGGFSGRAEGANRTDAGVNASSAAANASPGASAASSLPTASPTASAAASAAPSATPMGTATATPSRHTNKGDKGKADMTPVSPRRHTDPMNGSSDSANETSSSKQKNADASSEGSPAKKAHRRGTESSEPTATPKGEPEKE